VLPWFALFTRYILVRLFPVPLHVKSVLKMIYNIAPACKPFRSSRVWSGVERDRRPAVSRRIFLFANQSCSPAAIFSPCKKLLFLFLFFSGSVSDIPKSIDRSIYLYEIAVEVGRVSDGRFSTGYGRTRHIHLWNVLRPPRASACR